MKFNISVLVAAFAARALSAPTPANLDTRGDSVNEPRNELSGRDTGSGMSHIDGPYVIVVDYNKRSVKRVPAENLGGNNKHQKRDDKQHIDGPYVIVVDYN
ncbi:hypothetical protein VFPFJ_11076 [Purpureocillium lilacinum]|nr:hypothetical protein VFPFJ_11076 [Purpureocillium lilacinum]OAQ69574.1 hypothetical protein VFPFJ_11076 [Purpureocillium lilacinum]OAQ82522.1 hypothetical protein VFPBJ_05107 [Purpureocillium lilacinum]GJN73824.1 hypothetical protein PLICBS_007907 [Purpureocillium lilacinum]GJN84338.1 hypothetical protein PLIIFM63780_007894 [Purpureocillium lilacinum]